ncbi:cytoplasmic 60S subunit biogenesis factor ZNF622 [Bicyclus anynana]|uniref:Cytoplasmic 60S subunit biogenesis factor ZNF622 n=1 Tax=Bicyclus anynana TaxID=110368 RepID=A0A6J1MH23_BICAN|nr:cytoplasmic 60S subunit biogenesis factor ZNF622 [Bicyclus anynana]
MSNTYTCITCQVLFKTAELQREHYKLDWHRYNLKRKVASIPPVTLEEFEQRAKEHREQSQNAERDESEYCRYCSKLFNTKNAYNNHLNSKKHKLAEEKNLGSDRQSFSKKENINQSDSDSFEKVEPANSSAQPGKFVVVNAEKLADEDVETDSEIEELDSDEWDELRVKGSDSLIKPKDCLFCTHHSKNMVKNLKHMSAAHSFFIPDVEYCVDVKGLLLYLGEKISQGYMCLWCNEAGRTFYSMEAARAHMVDTGHCKMLHEGIALAEYADYYDYSASYPDANEGDDEMDVDEEMEGPAALEGDDFQLVLPSGVTVGHRSLMRYYKQNLTQSSQALVKKSDRKLHRLLGVYRALGWAPKEQALAVRKARDIHFMKRVQAKWQMKMSMKNNKFQKHYRPQVNF